MTLLTTHTLGSRLLAGFGTLALLGGISLAASRPAHTAGGPIAVSVANPVLLVADTQAALGPFQTVVKLPVVYGALIPIPLYYQGIFTVPAGKRLILQGVSANFVFSQTESPVLTLSTIVNGTLGFHNFTAVIRPDNGDGMVLTEQPMTVYADPGSTVTVRVYNVTSSDIRNSGAIATVTGYLVDAP